MQVPSTGRGIRGFVGHEGDPNLFQLFYLELESSEDATGRAKGVEHREGIGWHSRVDYHRSCIDEFHYEWKQQILVLLPKPGKFSGDHQHIEPSAARKSRKAAAETGWWMWRDYRLHDQSVAIHDWRITRESTGTRYRDDNVCIKMDWFLGLFMRLPCQLKMISPMHRRS